MNTDQLRENVIKSFQTVRADMDLLRQHITIQQDEIDYLKNKLISFGEAFHSINQALDRILVNQKETQIETPKEVIVKEESEEALVASSLGTTFHKESCIAAKNVNPKNKTVFASIEDAKSQGFKPCKACLS